jgi:hypothetical protein
MKKSLYEILEVCSKGKTVDDRVALLQQNASAPLLTILKYAYDPSIVFLLPDTIPPYKPTDFLDQENRLYSELRRLYLFIEGGNPNLTKLKREMLYIQLLESIDKNDAVLMCHVKDKKLPFKELTAKVVHKAFPDLIPEEVKQK